MLPILNRHGRSNESMVFYKTTTVLLYDTRIDSRKKIEDLLNPTQRLARNTREERTYVQVVASNQTIGLCVRAGVCGWSKIRLRGAKGNQEAVNRNVERGQQQRV